MNHTSLYTQVKAVRRAADASNETGVTVELPTLGDKFGGWRSHFLLVCCSVFVCDIRV
jgi:hypothetical protein